MRNGLCVFGSLAIFVMVSQSLAQADPQALSLCDLQARVAQGEHRTVRVEGVYSAGLEGQQLISSACPRDSTSIEFALKSPKLWAKLVRMSNPSNPVLVVFEGEFYGPRVPDPKLPEAIRKAYHPGWDHNSMTKLVVYSIESVRTVPHGATKVR